MMTSVKILFFTFLSACTVCRANSCGKAEIEYFSCQVGKKKGSLCGSKSNGTDLTYLQYRFGGANKLEFVFPENKENSVKYFRRSSNMLAHGGEVRVSFNNGQYKYVLYELWDMSRHPPYGGIYVLKDNKLVKGIQCANTFIPGKDLLETHPSLESILNNESMVDIK